MRMKMIENDVGPPPTTAYIPPSSPANAIANLENLIPPNDQMVSLPRSPSPRILAKDNLPTLSYGRN